MNPARHGSHQNRVHPPEKLTILLNELYKDVSGFDIPQKDYEEILSQGGAPTYGEIPFDSASTLIQEIQPTENDVFYDLGSGIGKFVIQMYLQSSVKKCIGIELSQSRAEKANQALKALLKKTPLEQHRSLQFIHQNVSQAALDDATIVFMCSTCFSDRLLEEILHKLSACTKGLRVISLRSLPKNEHFSLEKQLELPMTWSKGSPVYLYRKIA